jgi:hypothetical protein
VPKSDQLSALAQRSINQAMETDMIMPYREQLAPWIVVRLLPKMQRVVVGRYRSRSDADGHLAILRQRIPESEFVVVFDVQKLEDI